MGERIIEFIKTKMFGIVIYGGKPRTEYRTRIAKLHTIIFSDFHRDNREHKFGNKVEGQTFSNEKRYPYFPSKLWPDQNACSEVSLVVQKTPCYLTQQQQQQ